MADSWHCSPTAGHDVHGQSVVTDDGGLSIAIVYDGASHGQIIAAAPELLAVLKALAESYDCCISGATSVKTWREVAKINLRFIRDAISEATAR